MHCSVPNEIVHTGRNGSAPNLVVKQLKLAIAQRTPSQTEDLFSRT